MPTTAGERSSNPSLPGGIAFQNNAINPMSMLTHYHIKAERGAMRTLRNDALPPPVWGRIKTTPVFNLYWLFAAERQSIFQRRLCALPPPWTEDTILQAYKFTNVYRASDRVSQYLIRKVIYEGEQSPKEWFFRIILFKLFNSIATWELLLSRFGHLHSEGFCVDAFGRVLTLAIQRGQSIYSGAYIMPSGGMASPYGRKHQMHLHLLARMLRDELHEKVRHSDRMESVFLLLIAYPTIGEFLAYQFAIDLNYSPLTAFSETEFVCPGPGARDGLRKCFRETAGYTEADLIRMMMERQEDEFARVGVRFDNLWGRKLMLIDCQNIFCEVDKYSRVAYPEVVTGTGRTHIKQRFKPSGRQLEPWFPPKWGLNSLIGEPGV